MLNSTSIQFRYRIYQDPAEGCLIGFIAPKKKIRGAVQRNKIKRLLREVYRTNQHHLQDLFAKESFGLHGAFIAQNDGLTFDQIKSDMIPVLESLRGKLLASEYVERKTDQGGRDSIKNKSESKLS